jgi:hypothetical protein
MLPPMGSGDSNRPVGDFGFLAKFIFGFVFGAVLGAALFFYSPRGFKASGLFGTSLWSFAAVVITCAVIFGLLSGFLTGGKRWN